jgi:hypothetical protein
MFKVSFSSWHLPYLITMPLKELIVLSAGRMGTKLEGKRSGHSKEAGLTEA